jgi:hypothetical protein
VAERIFLMFDYESSGLWYPRDDGTPRALGMFDADELPLSDATRERLAAWVQRCDDLNMREYTVTEEPRPSRDDWQAVDDEALDLWRVLRSEAGPAWEIGVRRTGSIAWNEADLSRDAS